MRRYLVIFAGMAAALSVIGAGAAATSAPSGEIAYLQTRAKIFVGNADGNRFRELLSDSAMDTFNWSPHGRLIAYTAGPWGQPDEMLPSVIRIAKADGTLVRTLPRGRLASAYEPTWSRDGRQIAFGGWNEREDSLSIYVIRTDGTGLRRLTHPQSMSDESPDWSHDGRWVVFERYGWAPWSDVMSVRPDGTGLHRIARVTTGEQCACPDWSPDGTKIAYQASPNVTTSKYPEIYVMNSDGTGRTQLTFTGNRARDENPDWSPDGKWIAFYSERVGNAEIYVIGADGRHLTRITRDPAYVMYPRWRPPRTGWLRGPGS